MSGSSPKLHIAVVGGSLAGIMASIPLVRQGHSVTVLERSPLPLLQHQGAGIVAGGETQAFFAKHDRLARKVAVVSSQRLYLNHKGETIDAESHQQKMTSWDLLYYLLRANFDGVSSEYLDGKKVPEKQEGEGSASYDYARLVTGVKDVGEKIEVTAKDLRHYDGSSGDNDENDLVIQADFLIVADGASSSLRRMLLPDAVADKKYAGYVAFRGTVLETELSESAAAVFVERFTFYHGAHTQILAYAIPGAAGCLERGKRLINWVWYWNYKQDSDEYTDLMTDKQGKRHRLTLPTGGMMQDHVWEKQKQRATATLSPQFAELVTKTERPFVQAISDLPPPPAGTQVGRLLNGKAVIVGDALSGFRPHTAASTGQAALHALLLEEVFSGQMGWDEYEKRVLEHAKSWQEQGVMLGTRSQYGRHPLADE